MSLMTCAKCQGVQSLPMIDDSTQTSLPSSLNQSTHVDQSTQVGLPLSVVKDVECQTGDSHTQTDVAADKIVRVSSYAESSTQTIDPPNQKTVVLKYAHQKAQLDTHVDKSAHSFKYAEASMQTVEPVEQKVEHPEYADAEAQTDAPAHDHIHNHENEEGSAKSNGTICDDGNYPSMRINRPRRTSRS